MSTIALIKRNAHRHLIHASHHHKPKANLEWFKRQEYHLINKYHATRSAAEKNLGKPLDGHESVKAQTGTQVKAAAPASGGGGEALTDEQSGSYWSGVISIGTPAQDFAVDFDTGSSDLWVTSTATQGSSTTTPSYSPTASSTAKDQGRTFTISYGDGSTTSGEVYTDTVEVAGLTATNQSVGAATSVNSTTGAGFSGLLGMGYQTLSTENAPPFFATLVAENKVPSGVFSFNLAATGGELYLGGTDETKYTPPITYTPVTQQAYWTVALGGITVNSKTVISEGTRSAIIDTGTTLIYCTAADAKKFYAAIPDSHPLSYFGQSSEEYDGYYGIPTNGSGSIVFEFGGVGYEIPYSSFISQGEVGTKNGVEYSLGAIIGSNAATSGMGNTWLVGDAFLTNVYAAFDLENNQVGFANLA